MIFRGFFKKNKRNPAGLEDAFKIGLLTEAEYLRLNVIRAEDKLREYENKNEYKQKNKKK